MKRFVLHVVGCVEPELVGPFKTARARNNKARKLRNADDEDGVFWMNVTDKGAIEVGAFSGGYMEGRKGFPGPA